MFLEVLPERLRLSESPETPTFREKNIFACDTFGFQKTRLSCPQVNGHLETRCVLPVCTQMLRTVRRLLYQTLSAQAELEAAPWLRWRRRWHLWSHANKCVRHHTDQ